MFLMGPTGAGKTRVALALAARLPVEIVSVDATLVYRGLDIGSAKPNPSLRRRIPHHLIDICAPTEHYSAARFRGDALAVIDAIRGRGHIPLLVGGTGLYFRALERGLSDLPGADHEVRAGLEAELAAHGNAYLHAQLAAVDPQAAERIHPNDPQRLLRALEVYRLSGVPMSQLWRSVAPAAPGLVARKLVLAPARRADLQAGLRRRFLDMLERGFINEVQALRRRGDLAPTMPAMRAVGYRQIWRYLDGEMDYETMCERGVIASRQLAKRQLTWLRREPDCTWLDSHDARVVERALGIITGS